MTFLATIYTLRVIALFIIGIFLIATRNQSDKEQLHLAGG
jgi:hypothetical protein